jgi:hypothetical protein
MGKVNIVKFKSGPKRTFFAPEFDYTIFETGVEQVDFKELAKLLLSKEKEVLSLPVSTGVAGVVNSYTGLKENSTTQRYDKYNVLKWEDKNIKELKGNILNFHKNILKYFKQPLPNELYIQCWYNVMRKGEQIKAHLHNIGPNCYLGGHICVQCDDTSTHYINPINQINDPMIHSSKNDVGKLTMFPDNIPHYTDIHNSDKERITIAFDLLIEKPNKDFKDNYSGNLHLGNYLKLI